MARLSLGPLIEPGSVHDNLAIRSNLYVRAVHRARRRAFEVHSFAVIAAAVAGALEFILACLPVGSAAQMRAARVDNKNAVRSAVHPDAVFLLELGVYAKRVVGGIADFKNRGRLEKRAREEKAEKGNEPCAEKGRDRAPDQTAASFVGGAGLGPNGGKAACRCGFRRADSRSANVLRRVRAAGSRRFCRLRFRPIRFGFDRFRFRTRHAHPPQLYVLLEILFRQLLVRFPLARLRTMRATACSRALTQT